MTDYQPTALGISIKNLRNAKGLSAQKLADLLPEHMSRNTIAAVESGRKPEMYVADVVAVARALGVSVMTLTPELGLDLHQEAYKAGYEQAVQDMKEWAGNRKQHNARSLEGSK